MNPRATLVSCTSNPLAVLFCLWQQSREQTYPLPEDVDINDPKVIEIFEGVLNTELPITDAIVFNFVLDDISISFREQMVRHRVGVWQDERMSVDIVPDRGNSSWWGQGMRILDMGKFAQEGRFRIPETLKGKRVKFPIGAGFKEETMDAEEYFCMTMDRIESAYRKLLEAGVPMEDAREVIPLGATHRFSWTINLTALKHIIGKRGCWIPQLGLWKPIINSMIEELATKIHPYFRNLINPPCISGGKFKECVFKLDNIRRISREDDTLPCPMYLEHHASDDDKLKWKTGNHNLPPAKGQQFLQMVQDYGKLWGREPWTGEPSENEKTQAA